MKRVILFCVFCVCSLNAYAQLISTSSNLSPDQLVMQSLDNDCVTISNVSSVLNGSVLGVSSYGSFTNNGSNFPFANGFFISTGIASEAGNQVITSDLSAGNATWSGDTDLETALGITNTLNATVIEFDVTSVTDQISFNYLLASEEYQLDFPCNVGDGFALLIRPVGSTQAYTNMAIVPGTNTAVGINTVHPEVVGQCAAQNQSFYAGTQLGATNYEGRTVPMTATASVVPNQAYHIKLVVADQFDFRYDTAVFIESDSLTADVDLGNDRSSCTSVLLDGTVANPLASYSWLLNGTVIPNETAATYTATTTGVYTVRVTIPNGNGTCVITDDVNVTVDPNALSVNLNDVAVCDDATDDGIADFDIDAIISDIINTQGVISYRVTVYESMLDAQNQTNALSGSYTSLNNAQTIYVRIEDTAVACFGISTMQLIVHPFIDAQDVVYDVCDQDNDGITSIDLLDIDALAYTGSTTPNITYHSNINDAVADTFQLGTAFTNTTNPQVIYARVTDPVTGCFDTSMITINVSLAPDLDETLVEIDACDQDYDGFAAFNLTAVITDFTTVSGITVSYHTTQQDADDNVNPITNPSNYTNTTPRQQSVYVRIEDPVTGCHAIGQIDLYTNYLLDRTDVTDLEYCDDSSNDGLVSVDFLEIEMDFLNGIENVVIEFYETQSDQQADINRLDKNVGYTTSTNPQTIYIRIISPTCVELLEFQIEVLPYFTIDPIPDQTYCDQDQDLITNVQLNVFDDAVRGTFSSAFPVFYYATQQDADQSINRITSITNTTNPLLVYAQVINLDGCDANQPLSITILPAPIASDATGFIICDTDQDGRFVVDLTSQQSQITTDPDHLLSYHLTSNSAVAGTGAILNPASYNAQTQTVYVRVESIQTGCVTVVNQPIIVNTLPVFPVISTYNICEENNDGQAPFLLSTKDVEILNGQIDKETSYYTSLADANAGTNPIDKTVDYINTSNPQTIWVRVENLTDPSCYGVDSFTLEVNEAPNYNDPQDLSVCDDDNDGISFFDLQIVTSQMLSGITNNLTITYHESNFDALTGINPVANLYTNTLNPQPLYARIGTDDFCFEVASFELNVVEAPVAFTVNSSVTCDDDGDGIASFDLSFRESEIIGTRPFNSTVTWHNSLIDAEQGNNPIQNPDVYQNSTNPETVFLRLYNTVSRCYDISPLDLVVNLPPDFITITDYRLCDNPLNEVNLNDVNSSILISGTNHEIGYYASLQDAQDDVNELPTPYIYTSNLTTIYVRIEDMLTGCLAYTDFDLIVQPSPILPIAGSYDVAICDDDYDGIIVYDVADNTSAAMGNLNLQNHDISFYNSQQDAENQQNAIIGDRPMYNGQPIFTRVEELSLGCVSIGEFAIDILPLPDPPVSNSYTICDQFVTVDASTGAAGETYLWSTGATTPSIDVNTPGDYSVVVTSAAGCQSPPSRFLVLQSSAAMIDFIIKVDFGDPNSITVQVSGLGNYLYVLDNGEPQRSNRFLGVRRGYHDITVIDDNGCDPVTRQVLIIDYPRFFTPNADGYNDYWQVDDIDTFDQATFAIFDRYGKLLKTFDKDSIGWDGTYNGNPMPSSDYWFTLHIKDSDGDIEVKGHFSLKR